APGSTASATTKRPPTASSSSSTKAPERLEELALGGLFRPRREGPARLLAHPGFLRALDVVAPHPLLAPAAERAGRLLPVLGAHVGAAAIEAFVLLHQVGTFFAKPT